MKKLKDEISLNGRVETITIMEWRKTPGEILNSVECGKTFIITKAGKEIAILSKVPEKATMQNLDEILAETNKESRIIIQRDGSIKAVPV